MLDRLFKAPCRVIGRELAEARRICPDEVTVNGELDDDRLQGRELVADSVVSLESPES